MAVEDYLNLKINVVDGTATADMPGEKKAKKGSTPGVDVAKLTAGITGIADVTSELLSVVKEAVSGVLRPVRTMVVGILKLVAQLLRPITDMVVLLLMPVLQFIKPIIKVFADLMRPFRTAAYQLMKAANQETDVGKKSGLMQLAITTLFSGLSVGLLGIVGEIVKFTIGIVAQIVGKIINIVSFGMIDGDKVASDITSTVNKWIDTGISSVQQTALNGIATLAQGLGVDINTNLTKAIKTALTVNSEIFGQQNTKVNVGSSTSGNVKRIDLTNDQGAINYINNATNRANQYAGMTAGDILKDAKLRSKIGVR